MLFDDNQQSVLKRPFVGAHVDAAAHDAPQPGQIDRVSHLRFVEPRIDAERLLRQAVVSVRRVLEERIRGEVVPAVHVVGAVGDAGVGERDGRALAVDAVRSEDRVRGENRPGSPIDADAGVAPHRGVEHAQRALAFQPVGVGGVVRRIARDQRVHHR